jgi:hypothetical protein
VPARNIEGRPTPTPPGVVGLVTSQRKGAMNKRQLIEDIRKHNITAEPRFLAQFDEDALRQYLEHLEEARIKRIRFNTSNFDDSSVRMVG